MATGPQGLEPGSYGDDDAAAVERETGVRRDGGSPQRGEKEGFTAADPLPPPPAPLLVMPYTPSEVADAVNLLERTTRVAINDLGRQIRSLREESPRVRQASVGGATITYDPVQTAEEFARELDVRRTDQAHKEACLEIANRHGFRLARVWAPVVALVLLGFFAWIGFMVHQVSEQNTERHRIDHAHQVTVWCYADPNSDRGTSTVTGSPDDVKGFCPDARYPQP